MSRPSIEAVMERYWGWLREGTELHQEGDEAVINTPFLDRHNDYIQIFAEWRGEQWKLTDDGYTVYDLEASGVDLSSDKRQRMLAQTTNRLGVSYSEPEIFVMADESNFPRHKHRLIQAVLAIGDLFYTSRQNIVSLFLENVEQWLADLGARMVKDNNFAGRSGLTHHFDFVIPRSPEAPERILETVNRPERGNVERIMLAWDDVKQSRPESRMFALLNDVESSPPPESMNALKNYGVRPIPWSERDDWAAELAA